MWFKMSPSTAELKGRPGLLKVITVVSMENKGLFLHVLESNSFFFLSSFFPLNTCVTSITCTFGRSLGDRFSVGLLLMNAYDC